MRRGLLCFTTWATGLRFINGISSQSTWLVKVSGISVRQGICLTKLNGKRIDALSLFFPVGNQSPPDFSASHRLKNFNLPSNHSLRPVVKNATRSRIKKAVGAAAYKP